MPFTATVLTMFPEAFPGPLGVSLIGTAWREIVVTPTAPAGAPASTAGGEVAVELDQSVPIDLTVSISRGQNDSTFLWTFLTPHNVPLPDEQVITELDRGSGAVSPGVDG